MSRMLPSSPRCPSSLAGSTSTTFDSPVASSLNVTLNGLVAFVACGFWMYGFTPPMPFPSLLRGIGSRFHSTRTANERSPRTPFAGFGGASGRPRLLLGAGSGGRGQLVLDEADAGREADEPLDEPGLVVVLHGAAKRDVVVVIREDLNRLGIGDLVRAVDHHAEVRLQPARRKRGRREPHLGHVVDLRRDRDEDAALVALPADTAATAADPAVE